MRLIMMGTGPFAAPTFRSLYDSPHEMAALVTAPCGAIAAKKSRRRAQLREIAARHNTPILDPEDANAAESQARLAALAADLLVVCDYGQILAPRRSPPPAAEASTCTPRSCRSIAGRPQSNGPSTTARRKPA